MKILYFIILFTLYSFLSSAEIINDVVVNNNKRISKESIISLGNIKVGTNYDQSDLDQVLKNLYGTDFFSDIKISVENNTIIILIDENKIIQSVKINGIKSKTTQESILDKLQLKNRSPFVEFKVEKDLSRIRNSLALKGYYFSEVKISIEENNNDTVNLIYDIQLGKKAKISRIEFVGNKVFKNKKLRNLIVSEENKFWKFISKKKYLNKDQVARDERLLKNYYLNRGYYDVIINASSAQYLDNDSFTLTFNINAGKIYKINKTKLTLPIDYKKTNFVKVEKLLSKLESLSLSPTALKDLDNISVASFFLKVTIHEVGEFLLILKFLMVVLAFFVMIFLCVNDSNNLLAPCKRFQSFPTDMCKTILSNFTIVIGLSIFFIIYYYLQLVVLSMMRFSL